MASAVPDTIVQVGSRAWYGDDAVDLALPSAWRVEVAWPSTPPELTDDQILAMLRRPVGQAPLRELAAGAMRPVVLVDDISRPTPASRVMPFVLAELGAAGIANEAVTVVMATGTHGRPRPDAFEKKVGPLAAAGCRLCIHDHLGPVVRRGRTSFGTPVLVNPQVAAADYVIGIGGLYPQHTTWYGGGAKLVLGVLGERSIANLHYRHWHLSGRYAPDNDFRRDLNEVAALVGLRTSVTLHVDARRRPVRIAAGDHLAYYRDEVSFTRTSFAAPTPDGADVVIANAYPMDTSLTFAESKGMTPLKHAPLTASRVLIADCPEGDGNHGLFPLVNVPPHHYRNQRLRRQWMARADLPAKIRSRVPELVGAGTAGKIAARLPPGLRSRLPGHSPDAAGPGAGPDPAPARLPVQMFRPHSGDRPVQEGAARVSLTPTWDEVVARVTREQHGRRDLRALIYPCAPLHALSFVDEPVPEAETE